MRQPVSSQCAHLIVQLEDGTPGPMAEVALVLREGPLRGRSEETRVRFFANAGLLRELARWFAEFADSAEAFAAQVLAPAAPAPAPPAAPEEVVRWEGEGGAPCPE